MYGPDDKTTTKIAAGVILHDGAEPIMKRWVAADVTTNPFWRDKQGRSRRDWCNGTGEASATLPHRPNAAANHSLVERHASAGARASPRRACSVSALC
jgi:hypothetical protein